MGAERGSRAVAVAVRDQLSWLWSRYQPNDLRTALQVGRGQACTRSQARRSTWLAERPAAGVGPTAPRATPPRHHHLRLLHRLPSAGRSSSAPLPRPRPGTGWRSWARAPPSY